MMEYIGLFFELLLFFSACTSTFTLSASCNPRVESAQAQVANFRERNGWWMRLGGLAIMAIMLVNIYLHIVQLWGS